MSEGENAQLENEEPLEDLRPSSTYTLLQILRHWADTTKQKKVHLTYLLKLLKKYQPKVDYTKLPNVGHTLIKVKKGKFKRSRICRNG